MLTLAAVLAVALAVFLYFRLDDEAQRLCEAALNRHCEPYVARVGAARYTPGKGVTMYDVEIVERLQWRPPRGVLQIDELQVQGKFDIGTLLRGAPVVTRVVAKSPRLAVTRRENGTWNLSDLRLKPNPDIPLPRIDLHNATVLLACETSGAKTLGVNHLNAKFEPASDGSRAFNLMIAARDTLAKSLEARGSVAADGSKFRVEYKAESIEATPALVATFAHFGLAKPMTMPMQGVVSLSGEASRSAAATPLAWRTAFNFIGNDGRIPGVTRPLSNITLVGEATPAGIRLDQATARWGDSTIQLVGRREGWSFWSPLAARVRIQDLDAGAVPVDLLPTQVAKLWNRFRPAGRTDVAVDLAFDGQTWAPRATITAKDASFEDAEKFPYRLTNATGQILVNGGVTDDTQPPVPGPATVDMQLQGQADGAPVVITGSLRDVPLKPSPEDGAGQKMPPGWIEVSGNSIPISDRLVAAIPEDDAREFIEALHPTGRIDVRWRVERNSLEDPELHAATDMRLAECRMTYDRFPYPLSRVTGWIEQRGRQWRFYELRSRDTQGRTLVEGEGSLEPRDGSHRFELKLTGKAAPLDQTLFDALPVHAQQAWSLMRPQGQFDFVADISREGSHQDPTVRLRMRPHEQNLRVEAPLSDGRNRYLLERVDGDFYWADDKLTMKQTRAEHGRSVITCDGKWEALPGGAWKLELLGLDVDRLEFNRDFKLAAPAGLQSVIDELQPQGAFGLFDSRLEFTKGAGPTGPVTARWRLGLSCHQASFNAGVPIEGVSGEIFLSGQSDGASATTAGELQLDSLFWNDLQLTQVRGPLWSDGADCFLGEGAARKLQSTQARSVEAQAYGGAIKVNSWIRRGGQTRYGLAIGMSKVDVTRLSTEWLRRPETLHGSLDGQLKLQGVGASMYGLTGEGAMAVNDADLYQLPMFLGMLKVLRNRTPDTTAFNRLETKFTVDGDKLDFQTFDLLGDAFSLNGRGTATLQRNVDLTFATIVGRSEFAVPVLKAFVSSASEQFLRLRVIGSIDNPEIRREVLPAVGNALEQLQTDLGNRPGMNATRAASTPAARY